MKKILIIFTFAIILVACKKDPSPLMVDQTSLPSLVEGETKEIRITSGNGGYSVNSSTPAVASASIVGDKIVISALSYGETIITIRDKDADPLTLRVEVLPSLFNDSSPRFEWKGNPYPNKGSWVFTFGEGNSIGLGSIQEKVLLNVSIEGTSAKLLVETPTSREETRINQFKELVKEGVYYAFGKDSNGSFLGIVKPQ